MVKRGKKTEAERLLTLWHFSPQEPLPFSQIATEAAKMGYTKRTVINYLNQLTEKGILEKIVDKNRCTFYKVIDKHAFEKELVKQNVDALPLVITADDLKLSTPPFEMQILNEKGKTTKVEKVESHYSAAFESETIRKWKKELTSNIKKHLEEHYPNLKEKDINVICDVFAERFFSSLENSIRLNILSNLNLPSIKPSKWKKLSGKVEKTLYAKVWQHLFEALALLSFEAFKQHSSLEDFLKEGDRQIMITASASIPTKWLTEYLKTYIKLE